METTSARSPSDGSTTPSWCDCPDAPVYVRGPATFLEHPGGCEFPLGICTVRAHRVTVHEKCGRELAVRFCACLPSGLLPSTPSAAGGSTTPAVGRREPGMKALASRHPITWLGCVP